jgi:hypothetical protein
MVVLCFLRLDRVVLLNLAQVDAWRQPPFMHGKNQTGPQQLDDGRTEHETELTIDGLYRRLSMPLAPSQKRAQFFWRQLVYCMRIVALAAKRLALFLVVAFVDTYSTNRSTQKTRLQ